ncbi:hypothetical protein ACIPEQ_04000 [Curtobacterium sp. NPDC087080]|uniref:hypothetical protein n=1 Tax=Curtobacterium sp. NPDC087080 TaxID=3363965 RepID=UPI003825422F
MASRQKRSVRLMSAIGAATVVLAGVVVPAAAASAATASNVILDSWEDAKGRQVFVREGTYDATSGKGFGMQKIRDRHNLHKISSLKFVVANPNGGEAEGLHRKYEAWANRQECVDGKCKYTDSIPVRVIMNNEERSDYYGVQLRGQKIGISTAYCLSDSKAKDCPSWVDKALAAPTDFGARSQTSSDASSTAQERATLTYEPLAAVPSGIDESFPTD